MDAPRIRALDVAGAVVVGAGLVVATSFAGGDADSRSFDVLGAVLVAIAGGALALHRRAPLVALGVVTAALAAYRALDYPGGPVYFTAIGAIFAVSVARGPGKAWLPALVSTATILAIGIQGAKQVFAALFVSWVAGALLLGGSIRGRRAERAVLEERARHLAETREEEARRRVAEERVRIARDLHDSVAHSLASISVQAGVGAHVLEERPDDAKAALLAIKHASGDALTELRATLGMLRSDEAAPLEPTAGLSRLPALVDNARAAGLEVDVVTEGDVRPLTPAVDAVAFRIVQESLTNVIRHAGPTRATVAVRHGEAGVEIEVTDDGRGGANGSSGGETAAARQAPGGSAGGGSGHGLAGMRERVALLGGDLHAGARPSGGYRVRARLPL